MLEFNPADLAERDVYKLMTGSIVPRAIAWVSTVAADGVPNLAPFSYFTAVCSNPPTVVFCTSVRNAGNGQKDTFNNVRATGAFVINFVTEALAEAMNSSAVEVPPEVDEFERAGLTPIASTVVPPPGVQETPIRFECTLNQIVTINDQPGGGHLIIGTIVYMHFSEIVYREGHYIDIAAYQPVGRLAGRSYTRVNDLFDLARPPSELNPKPR